MPELPGGTLTIVHTDVENSTHLTVHLGDRYPEVLTTHCALLRAAFAAHEGNEVDTQGDSFFVVFPRATQAVAAAVAVQRALAAEAWPEGGAVRRGSTSSAARASRSISRTAKPRRCQRVIASHS